MARIIATAKAVNAAADQLIAEGNEVTVIEVHKRTGGSYTTVKQHLDQWQAQRARQNELVQETPDDVRTQATEFATHLWSTAAKLARLEFVANITKAQADAQESQLRLGEAESEIARLDHLETQQSQLIEQLKEQLHQSEIIRVEALTTARQIPGLEKALLDSQQELKLARKEAGASAIEAAKLSGEITALRMQTAAQQKERAQHKKTTTSVSPKAAHSGTADANAPTLTGYSRAQKCKTPREAGLVLESAMS